MPAVGVRERADEGHLVGDAGHSGERAADRDAGDIGRHVAGDAAILGRRGHLRVEGLDVRRTAPQPDPDHGCVLDRLAAGRSLGSRRQQLRQGEHAGPQSAHFQELAAGGAFAVTIAAIAEEVQHDRFSVSMGLILKNPWLASPIPYLAHLHGRVTVQTSKIRHLLVAWAWQAGAGSDASTLIDPTSADYKNRLWPTQEKRTQYFTSIPAAFP